MYDAVDEDVLASVATWLRVLAPSYTPRAAAKLLLAAELVEHHNERMAKKRAYVPASRPPERPAA